jgi:DNA repair protein RecN (Recombination protein N)
MMARVCSASDFGFSDPVMLSALSIRDIVLIDRLDLSFKAGLSVLTGETGAGKSILLDALGLALGARADSGLVRHGASQATVTATFEFQDIEWVSAVLDKAGLSTEAVRDGLLLLRRIVSADGRSRAFVDDQPVSVGTLRGLGDALVEIQGQFDAHGLLDPSTHQGFLDDFAGHIPPPVWPMTTPTPRWRRRVNRRITSATSSPNLINWNPAPAKRRS